MGPTAAAAANHHGHHGHRRRRKHPQYYRINFPFLSRFRIQIPSRIHSIPSLLQFIGDLFMYVLGPVLVVIVFALLGSLSYVFFTVVIPLLCCHRQEGPLQKEGQEQHANQQQGRNEMDLDLELLRETGRIHSSFYALMHETFVLFILFNIIFNYVLCVTTTNHHLTKQYQAVVKKLAQVTHFSYPESDVQKEEWREEYRQGILQRSREIRQRNSSNNIINNNHDSRNEVNMRGRYSNTTTSFDVDVESAQGANANATKTTQQTHQTQQTTSKRPWMLLGPHDWGYCEKSNQPKPPRSHFDFCTRSLVLNMDHYCPWMFNVVGYFNYRYFMNFLIYVSIGMVYGSIMTFQLFFSFDSLEYHEQIVMNRQMQLDAYNLTMSHDWNETLSGANHEMNPLYHPTHDHHTHRHHGPNNNNNSNIKSNKNGMKLPKFHYSSVKHLLPGIPTPNERLPICFSFMMCTAVGIAVLALTSFHIYLICTSQTTIEFHGNMMKRRIAKENGEIWYNPYRLGLKRNIEQVWGRIVIKDEKGYHLGGGGSSSSGIVGITRSSSKWRLYKLRLRQCIVFFGLLLPSTREPEFLPVPIKGENGRRKKVVLSRRQEPIEDLV